MLIHERFPPSQNRLSLCEGGSSLRTDTAAVQIGFVFRLVRTLFGEGLVRHFGPFPEHAFHHAAVGHDGTALLPLAEPVRRKRPSGAVEVRLLPFFQRFASPPGVPLRGCSPAQTH